MCHSLFTFQCRRHLCCVRSTHGRVTPQLSKQLPASYRAVPARCGDTPPVTLLRPSAASFLSRWEEAAEFAGLLLRESRWSRTIYSYLRAAALLSVPGPADDARQQEVSELMSTLPDFKQRIAGKSLPAEKFVIRKSRRFLAQGGRLLMPGYELLYLWNGFKILRKRRHLVEDLFSEVEHRLAALDGGSSPTGETAARGRASQRGAGRSCT